MKQEVNTMSQREIKYESPKHKIFAGKEDYEGYNDGDVLAIAFESRNHGTLHRFYTLGSVVGYAIKTCNCPFEQVERAKKLGHQLHWANSNSVSISSRYSKEKDVSFMVEQEWYYCWAC